MNEKSISQLLQKENRQHNALFSKFTMLLGKLPDDFVLSDVMRQRTKDLEKGYEFANDTQICATRIRGLDIRIVETHGRLITKYDTLPRYDVPPTLTFELAEQPPEREYAESSPFYRALRNLFEKTRQKYK